MNSLQMIDFSYFNVVGASTILVETFSWLSFGNVKKGFESNFTLCDEMNMSQRPLGILGDCLVKLFVFICLHFRWSDVIQMVIK